MPKPFLKSLVAALLFICALFVFPLQTLAQSSDPDAPCGRDENGLAYQCSQDASANLEASCLTSADPRYCLPYHQRACQVQGFALACQLYSIGANCNGGDPNQCNYYVGILQANRDCALNNNPAACTWLQQQGL